MTLTEEKIKELNKKLQMLAIEDFEQFCLITEADRLCAAIYFYWKEGKSERWISQRTGIPKSTIHDKIKKLSALTANLPNRK